MRREQAAKDGVFVPFLLRKEDGVLQASFPTYDTLISARAFFGGRPRACFPAARANTKISEKKNRGVCCCDRVEAWCAKRKRMS